MSDQAETRPRACCALPIGEACLSATAGTHRTAAEGLMRGVWQWGNAASPGGFRRSGPCGWIRALEFNAVMISLAPLHLTRSSAWAPGQRVECVRGGLRGRRVAGADRHSGVKHQKPVTASSADSISVSFLIPGENLPPRVVLG